MTNREKLELTRFEALDILNEVSNDYEIVSNTIDDRDRWTVTYCLIIKRLSDGKFFRDYYRTGATESQDEGPWEYEIPSFVEVRPVAKTITVYE
jgi:hypothetical protein